MPVSKKPVLDSKLAVRRDLRKTNQTVLTPSKSKTSTKQITQPGPAAYRVPQNVVDKHVAFILEGKKPAIAQLAPPTALEIENSQLKKLLLATTESIEHYAQDNKGAVVMAHAAVAAQSRTFLENIGFPPKKKKQ